MNIQNQITSIVDKHLNWWIDNGLNKLPIRNMQIEMSDPNQNPKEEWRTWFPIKSDVTDADINGLEFSIGYKYPESYKIFLKHKHFYDLQIGEVSFCRHPINVWKECLSEMIFDGYPKQFLIDKGLIPFANYSDWGLLCFDTTTKKDNNGEYSIALWNHERAFEKEIIHKNFIEMLMAIDKENENSH